MRVLVSTKETQGQRDNDFCWVPEGELVMPNTLVCDRDPDGPCGCMRDMIGVEGRKGTTTMAVAERPDLDLQGLADAFAASERRAWELEDPKTIEEVGRDCLRMAEAVADAVAGHEPGTVFEKRKRIQPRGPVR